MDRTAAGLCFFLAIAPPANLRLKNRSLGDVTYLDELQAHSLTPS
jgi:hypothetical protein